MSVPYHLDTDIPSLQTNGQWSCEEVSPLVTTRLCGRIGLALPKAYKVNLALSYLFIKGHPATHPTGRLPSSVSPWPNSQKSGKHSTPGPSTSWRPLTLMQRRKTLQRKAGNSWKWCLRAKTDRHSRPQLTIELHSREAADPSWQELDAIATTIKSEEHFWHFWDELLLDMCQQPNKGTHSLSIPV